MKNRKQLCNCKALDILLLIYSALIVLFNVAMLIWSICYLLNMIVSSTPIDSFGTVGRGIALVIFFACFVALSVLSIFSNIKNFKSRY